MNKNQKLTAITFAVAQLTWVSAYAQSQNYPGCHTGDANSFLSQTAQTVKNTPAQTKQLAIDYARAIQTTLNMTPEQASSVIGNLMFESDGLNSGLIKVDGTIGEATIDGDNAKKNYGIAQWGEERKKKLIWLATQGNIPSSSQCANWNYLVMELIFDPSFFNMTQSLRAEKDLANAVHSFEAYFESLSASDSQDRIDYAKQVLSWFQNPTTTIPPENSSTNTPENSSTNTPPCTASVDSNETPIDEHHGEFAHSQAYRNLSDSERNRYWKMNQRDRKAFRKQHSNNARSFDGHRGAFASSQAYRDLSKSERAAYWKMNETDRETFRSQHSVNSKCPNEPSAPSNTPGSGNPSEPSNPLDSSNPSDSGNTPHGINLSNFGNLQLPIGSPGKPDTIQAQSLSNYNSEYFKHGNGKITLIVPLGGGVTTANSKYPRTELRENRNWKMSDGTATLQAIVSVDKLPSTGNIVIGQIHQNNGGVNRPPIELHFINGNLVAGIMKKQTTQSGSPREKRIIATGIKTGEKFSYSMVMSRSGKVDITVNGATTSIQLDSSFNNSNFYFKAGNYVQDQTGGSAVSFYGLDISHN